MADGYGGGNNVNSDNSVTAQDGTVWGNVSYSMVGMMMGNIPTGNVVISAVQVPAPSNAPPTKMQRFQKWALNTLCGTSPTNKIESSMVDGGASGTVGGALEGGFAGTVLTIPAEGLGGIPGAAVGGFVGGVFGASMGIIQGAEMAGACSLFNVY
jgi:hypothetical protein